MNCIYVAHNFSILAYSNELYNLTVNHNYYYYFDVFLRFLEFWLGDMVILPNCWSPERSVAMLLLPMLFSAALL